MKIALLNAVSGVGENEKGKKRKIKFKMKPTKFQIKFTKILFILLIPLLLTAVVLLGYELKNKAFLYKIIISTIFIIYILIFIFILILMLTKFKKDLELGIERPLMRVFNFSLFIFMVIAGLIDILISKTWRNFHILFLGIILLILNIILNKKYKERNRKQNLKY